MLPQEEGFWPEKGAIPPVVPTFAKIQIPNTPLSYLMKETDLGSGGV
jgi:hypothetical protein